MPEKSSLVVGPIEGEVDHGEGRVLAILGIQVVVLDDCQGGCAPLLGLDHTSEVTSQRACALAALLL
jgi:hypothetical protein